MWLDETSKGLRYGHDTGAGFVVAGGLEHQLRDGLLPEHPALTEAISIYSSFSASLWKGANWWQAPNAFPRKLA